MKMGVILFWMVFFTSSLQAGKTSCHPPKDSYTEVYSTCMQRLLPEEAVRLEKVKKQSSEIDLSFASSGLIIFRRPGAYKLVWRGLANSPFNRPWTLGFSLDGVILFGNVYGPSLHQRPPEAFEGSVVFSVNAGQSLRFINASSHPVQLVSESGGPSFTLSIFYSDLSYLGF